MSTLSIRAIPTRIFSPGENLTSFVIEHIAQELVQERMVIAVTSKIVSLAENRLVSKASVADKTELIRKESDVFLGEVGYGCSLTIKEGLFIPSAGIDESNSVNGDYILYPKDPFASAKNLWQQLRAHWKLRELGLLLTDSHTSPLRKGVTGICLSYWGFEPVKNLVGTSDLFGRELKMTNINMADALSCAAVLMMGEGREQQPLALLNGADCRFTENTNPADLRMPLHDDLYYPFFKGLIDSN